MIGVNDDSIAYTKDVKRQRALERYYQQGAVVPFELLRPDLPPTNDNLTLLVPAQRELVRQSA